MTSRYNGLLTKKPGTIFTNKTQLLFPFKESKKLMENSLLTKVDFKACQKRIVLLLCKLLIQLNRCGAIAIILLQSARMTIDSNYNN
jgi:hypothetical protein